MCTSAKKRLMSSPLFKPRLRLGQKTQPRTKKMHFLALIHNIYYYSSKFYCCHCFIWFCFCPTGAFFSNALETTKDNVKVSTNFIQLILYETVKEKQKMLTILLLKCH
jgi:hypothetical protein